MFFFMLTFHWSFSLLEFEFHTKDNLRRDKGICCLLSVFHSHSNHCRTGWNSADIFLRCCHCLIVPHHCEINGWEILWFSFPLALWSSVSVFGNTSCIWLSHWKMWCKYFGSTSSPWDWLWETAWFGNWSLTHWCITQHLSFAQHDRHFGSHDKQTPFAATTPWLIFRSQRAREENPARLTQEFQTPLPAMQMRNIFLRLS